PHNADTVDLFHEAARPVLSGRVVNRSAFGESQKGPSIPDLTCTCTHLGRLAYRPGIALDGTTSTPRAAQGDRARRLVSELGRAVGALQSIDIVAFSSRFDESAPSFADWADYIA